MAFTLGFHIILASLGVALPALMLIANYRGLRHDDADALELAQRWSKAAAVTFAVGAVTGTVLSFEFGLLWPAFTGRFGQVFGVLFAIEGIFFFLEAIFIAIYIFGWRYLSPWAHFWSGVPVAISGIGGAFSVVAVNSWMNQPQGFSPTSGKVTSVDPWQVIFNPAVPYEVPHMILAAYLVTGFLVAGIYAVGMLRGRRDRIHRLGLLIPLTVAAIVTPVQFAVGDTAARAIAKDQPIKFAGMECVDQTATHVTEYIYGRCTSTGVKGGIGIPGFDSFLVGWSTSTQVTGLDSVPPDDRPPANTMLHWAFDTMVGICTVLIGLGAWFGFVWWRRRDIPQTKWFLRACALSGVAAIVALECGWIVTEVGRQPWIVYQIMRTSDAVTQSSGIWITFSLVLAIYVTLGAALIITLLSISRRWREQDVDRRRGAVRPGHRTAPDRGGRGMNLANAVAVVLVVGVTMYAVFGGADFGAGLWSLLAGGGDRGRRPRALIDWAIGPVWEANHVWLIFVLVVLWTGFPTVFGSIFSTLFIPLSLAAFGIVLRGSGFAFQHTARRARGRALATTALRRLVGADAVLPRDSGRRRRRRARPGRQRGGRRRHELGEPALARHRRALRRHRRLPGERLPRQRRAPRRDPRPGALLHRSRRCRRHRHGALAVVGLFMLHRDAREDLRRPEERRPAAGAALGGVRARRARPAAPRRPTRRARAGGRRRRVRHLGLGRRAASGPPAAEPDRRRRGRPERDAQALLIVFGVAVVVVLPSLGLLFTLVQRNLVEETSQPTIGP